MASTSVRSCEYTSHACEEVPDEHQLGFSVSSVTAQPAGTYSASCAICSSRGARHGFCSIAMCSQTTTMEFRMPQERCDVTAVRTDKTEPVNRQSTTGDVLAEQQRLFDDFYGDNGTGFSDAVPPELKLLAADHESEATALDLGCGDGRITLFLASAGYLVTGVDVSSVGLDHIRSAAIENGLDNRITLLQHDIRALSQPPESFDLVAAVTVLDHLPRNDVAATFDRIVDVIKPGGILFVQVHNADDPGCTGDAPASELQTAIKYYFPQRKLLDLADGRFEILNYDEKTWEDRTHGAPHTHAFSTLLGRRL
ncbi:methyltransferase domain-containing protein [candidate division GN15 bacterium]|nr:methyltransferase domain-containing protein [candidate division GN15 bacterium]